MGKEPAQPYTVPANASATSELPSASNAVEDDNYTPLGYYKMEAKPRGICVIVDNQIFKADPNDKEANPKITNREGSDKDCESLKKTFGRLHFIIVEKKNQKDTEIVDVMKKISSEDHTNFDCFICIILSHGGENYVYGVNGRKVLLKDITKYFNAQSCESLARKPKLFFMACCRGTTHQRGYNLPEPLLETDTATIDYNTADWVPNESDFLFGYSTVINHVSYRSKRNGTFYINELTKVLDNYAHREDIQTLLLRVNDEVSKRIYSEQKDGEHIVYKQTPAPQHTLRKLLKFL